MIGLNDYSKGIRILSEGEIDQVYGAWHPFPHGIFGRDGKPFIGRDVFRVGVPVAVKIGVALIPGGAPFSMAAGAVAEAIVDHNT